MADLKPAVFLDRDGTLIEEAEYLRDIKDLKLFKNTAKAIKKLNETNIITILITNQSGVARGYFDEENVKFLNESLNNFLKEENAHIDGFYYCPHHPKGIIEKYSFNCDCRKPEDGLIKQAISDFKNIELKRSYIIGDKPLDIKLARNVGCKGILVKTGYGMKTIEGKYEEKYVEPDFIAEDIEDAVNWLLEDLK